MSNIFGITARAFRFYEDGTETGATAIDAENTNITRYTGDPVVVLRYGVQESGSGSASGASTDDYQLQYSKNGGAYTNVTGASTNVRGFTSADLTDAAATTQRLSAGTGSFVAGEIAETDGLLTDWALTANNFSDLLYVIELVAGDLADNDTLDFRVLRNGAVFNTYSVTPRITADTTPPPITGDLTQTIADVTSSATGTVAVAGSSAVTVDAVTSSAAGAVANTGALGATVDPVTVNAAGAVAVIGDVTQPIGDVTISAAGTVADAGAISGSLSVTIDPVTAVATGTAQVLGAAEVQVDAVTGGAAGAVLTHGDTTQTIAAVGSSATGAVALTGAASATIDAVTLSASGTTGGAISGELATTIGAVTVEATGTAEQPPSPPTQRRRRSNWASPPRANHATWCHIKRGRR